MFRGLNVLAGGMLGIMYRSISRWMRVALPTTRIYVNMFEMYDRCIPIFIAEYI